jgi:hypothetical protein
LRHLLAGKPAVVVQHRYGWEFASGKRWEWAFRYPELGFEMDARPEFEIFVRLFAFGLVVRSKYRLGGQLHVYLSLSESQSG